VVWGNVLLFWEIKLCCFKDKRPSSMLAMHIHMLGVEKKNYPINFYTRQHISCCIYIYLFIFSLLIRNLWFDIYIFYSHPILQSPIRSLARSLSPSKKSIFLLSFQGNHLLKTQTQTKKRRSEQEYEIPVLKLFKRTYTEVN
jgi:hypothetical protein